MILYKEQLIQELILPKFTVDWEGLGRSIRLKLIAKAKMQSLDIQSENHQYGVIEATYSWEFKKQSGVIPVTRDVNGRLTIKARKSGEEFRFGIEAKGSVLDKTEWDQMIVEIWKSQPWVKRRNV